MKEILSHPKHLLFAPVYYLQGKKVKAETPSLPEAIPLEKQARQGSLRFVRNNNPEKLDDLPKKSAYRFMIVGDSSAAGVGVEYQSQALLGQLVRQLFHSDDMYKSYSTIHWQLHATTGHTSFDVLRRLYLLPVLDKPLNLLIIVVGVNDATQMQSVSAWKKNLDEILTIVQQKLQPKNIIFTALPPLNQFPAMPYPLNEFIGEKSTQLDQYMQEFCNQHKHLHYVDFDIPVDSKYAPTDYFAIDKFHPSGLTYRLWAERLYNEIEKFE